jgi:hypothetical protein
VDVLVLSSKFTSAQPHNILQDGEDVSEGSSVDAKGRTCATSVRCVRLTAVTLGSDFGIL